MWRRLSVFLILLGSAISLPVRAFAQPWAQQSDNWYGPWFMWGGGWSSWWWICPLMMVVMMLVMMFACRFMCSWHRD